MIYKLKKEKKRENQKVRCEWDLKSHAGHAGHLPCKTEKVVLKKKILSNAYETIVANGNHNYMLDRMNKVYQGQTH